MTLEGQITALCRSVQKRYPEKNDAFRTHKRVRAVIDKKRDTNNKTKKLNKGNYTKRNTYITRTYI